MSFHTLWSPIFPWNWAAFITSKRWEWDSYYCCPLFSITKTITGAFSWTRPVPAWEMLLQTNPQWVIARSTSELFHWAVPWDTEILLRQAQLASSPVLYLKTLHSFFTGSSAQYWPLLHRHLHIALTPFFLLSASLLVHDWLSPTCPFPICLTMSVPHTPSYQVYPLHNHTSLTPSLPENSTSNNSRPQLVGG